MVTDTQVDLVAVHLARSGITKTHLASILDVHVNSLRHCFSKSRVMSDTRAAMWAWYVRRQGHAHRQGVHAYAHAHAHAQADADAGADAEVLLQAHVLKQHLEARQMTMRTLGEIEM